MVRLLFIFIDGVGLAPAADDNPVNPSVCPFLCRLIKEKSVPIDSCLGVDGLPQSATGQATMFTGRNASQYMGRHVEGFPGPTLRKFVERQNIFLDVKARGKKGRFADAYLVDSVDEIRNRRFKSVTTTAALTVPESVSIRSDLLANQAVAHDITRETFLTKGYQGAVVTPAAAADHLVQLALGYDFTLFEYFLSDQAGHSRDMDRAKASLSTLDDFLAHVFTQAASIGMAVVLTSDHGNIECLSVKGHSRNPVPLIATGPGEEHIRKAKSLVDLEPLVLDVIDGVTRQ